MVDAGMAPMPSPSGNSKPRPAMRGTIAAPVSLKPRPVMQLESSTQRRAMCANCLRAQRTCICHSIAPIAPASEVLILQHPMEVLQAKGSARLLHLSLRHSRLEVGGHFPDAVLHPLLHAPWDTAPDHSDSRSDSHSAIYPVLLYPDQVNAPNRNPPARFDASEQAAGRQLRLVVIDATWRKSSGMLQAHPLLQQLPRVVLHQPPASRYLIRKAHRMHQLSTLEAVCHALATLENDGEKYQPLLEAFDRFVAERLAFASQPTVR
jgi:DTW domain-containing protein